MPNIRNTEYRQINVSSYHKSVYTDYNESRNISYSKFDDGSTIEIHHTYRMIIVCLTNGVRVILTEY